MQPEMLMCSLPISRCVSRLAKRRDNFLRHGNRARVGKAAIIEPRAGDDVGHQPDIRRRDADGIERAPQRRQIALRDMRQRQVLLVVDADFAERIALGEIGDGVHLLGGGVAGRAALRLERERDDGVARLFVIGDGVRHPGVELRTVLARGGERRRAVGQRLVTRIGEARRDISAIDRRIERQRAVLDLLPLGVDLLARISPRRDRAPES